jgi:hypothetical protein
VVGLAGEGTGFSGTTPGCGAGGGVTVGFVSVDTAGLSLSAGVGATTGGAEGVTCALRLPHAKMTVRKTWIKMKNFLFFFIMGILSCLTI